jgi:hypothetical protein
MRQDLAVTSGNVSRNGAFGLALPGLSLRIALACGVVVAA